MLKNRKNFIIKAFTLIELLLVISVLGVLAILGTGSFLSSQKQAKDVKIKSDLKQYETALELYANKNGGKYPRSGMVTGASVCTYLSITDCPVDSTVSYYYTTGDTVSDGAPKAKSYAVWSSQLASQPSFKWMICSNGQEGTSATDPGVSSGSGGSTVVCTVGSKITSPTPTPLPPTTYAYPPAVVFTNVVVGQSSTLTVAVTNTGTNVGSVSSSALSGTNSASYSIVSGGACPTLNPGATCALDLRFSPSSVGAKNASLDITTSGGLIQIPVTGQGI